MTKETEINTVRDILRIYLADCLVDDIMEDMSRLAEEKLEAARMEALHNIQDERSSRDTKLAWYMNHMGEMDMLKFVGLISADRRNKHYRDWTDYHPE